MNKKLKIFIIISTILVVLAAIVLYYYFGASYKYFKNIGSPECKIPGLSEGFTPQGMSYDEESGSLLISGYMKNENESSRLYVVNGTNYSQQKYITLTNGGENFYGHSGGVAVYQSNVFIASEGKVYRLSKDEVLNAENKASVAVIDSFETKNGAAFVTVKGSELWVGEFYHGGNYETADSHRIETADHDQNMALAFCYTLNSSSEFGVASTTPIKALSLPALAQGIDFYDDGKIVLSTSYSVPDSKMYIYSDILSEATEKTFDYDGTQIPLYELTSSKVVHSFSMPCMSEEIVVKNGRVLVLFESASQKYRLIARTRMDYIYSLNIKFE